MTYKIKRKQNNPGLNRTYTFIRDIKIAFPEHVTISSHSPSFRDRKSRHINKYVWFIIPIRCPIEIKTHYDSYWKRSEKLWLWVKIKKKNVFILDTYVVISINNSDKSIWTTPSGTMMVKYEFIRMVTNINYNRNVPNPITGL